MAAAGHSNNLLEGPTYLADTRSGFLTPREAEITMLGTEGFKDKEIARLLGIAPRTVMNHFANIEEKLGAFNRMQVTGRAIQLGILMLREERGFIDFKLLLVKLFVGVFISIAMSFIGGDLRRGPTQPSRGARNFRTSVRVVRQSVRRYAN